MMCLCSVLVFVCSTLVIGRVCWVCMVPVSMLSSLYSLFVLMFFILGGVLVSMWVYVRRWLAVRRILFVMMCSSCVFFGLML